MVTLLKPDPAPGKASSPAVVIGYPEAFTASAIVLASAQLPIPAYTYANKPAQLFCRFYFYSTNIAIKPIASVKSVSQSNHRFEKQVL